MWKSVNPKQENVLDLGKKKKNGIKQYFTQVGNKFGAKLNLDQI
jgi:hypothetical protein